jgi:predicted nucleic acid-binding protein
VSSTYVLDTGALIAAERRKARALGFFQLARVGWARLVIPLPVVAEWWRGKTDVRVEMLAASSVIASLDAAKAAGVALGHIRGGGVRLTVDAVVMATAALLGAIVVTSDPGDFDRLTPHFPGVTVLSV